MSVLATAQLTLDPGAPLVPLRRIHGVNGTGVSGNYWLDLTPWYRRWQIPVARLHDAPFDAHNTIDLHHIFANPAADPDDPANYQFALSDDIIAHLRDSGTAIYFRLGESIEHQPRLTWNTVERWDPEVLATVCANIVRHYNHGWADGHEWGIEYWEFWNEPHGPKNWNGTPEQFFDRYRLVAPAVKAVDPDVRIGLAGFMANFPETAWGEGIARLAADGVPVDFVSWHAYLTDLSVMTQAAHTVRGFLDHVGLAAAESHLGEWAWRPSHDGLNIFSAYRNQRRDHVARVTELMAGPGGLATTLGGLLLLQDLPIDQAHYYTANTSPRWGLFDAHGQPTLRGLAFDLFASLLRRSEQRWSIDSDAESVVATAVPAGDGRIRVVVVNLADEVDEITVRVAGGDAVGVADLAIHDGVTRHALLPPEARHEDGVTEVSLHLSGPGALVLDLAPADESGEPGLADRRQVGSAVRHGDW